MSDLDTRLRAALHELAPPHPAADGLADGARRYAVRARRVRQVGLAAATAAILVVAGVVAGSLERPGRVVPAGPFLTPADCTRQAPRSSSPAPDGEPMAGVGAAWVCPDVAARETGSSSGTLTGGTEDGWRLPAAQLTAQPTQGLNIGGRADESSCGSIRPGPAFTVTLESTAGQLTTYRSGEMACAGAFALASFLDALADEEADAKATRTPDDGLACRSSESWPTPRQPVALDSPLVSARFCLAPSFLTGDPIHPIEPMAARSYVSKDLSAEVVASLNEDLTHVQGFRGNGECSGEGSWTYAVMGLTGAGERRMLATACLDELWIVGRANYGLIPSAQTTAMLRALVPPA